MNDVTETNETTETTETTEAPVTIEEAPADPKKGTVLKRNFVQKGGSEIVVITPVDEDDNRFQTKSLEVAFGEYHTWREDDEGQKSSEKLVGRFQVSYPRVIDGVEENLIVLGVNAAKTVELAIKQSGRGTVDDYLIGADYEADFFKQKIAAPVQDGSDVWTNEKYASIRSDLSDFAGDAEVQLQVASDSQVTSQADFMKLSKIIASVYEKLKTVTNKPRGALASWAKGPEGANHPMLKKLGSGTNALTEAMRLSELSDAEFAVLPQTLTSGKGIDRHRSLGVAELVEEASRAVHALEYPVELTSGPAPNAAGAAVMLRTIAERGFGIEGALDTNAYTLEALVVAVNEAAAAKAAEFMVDFGKNINTYQATEYKYALRTFGRVHVSEGGSNMFAEAVGQIQQIASIEGGDDAEKVTNETAALFNKNLMMRHMLKAALAHRKTLDTEKVNRDMFKQLEGEESPLTTQKTVKGFGNLPPLAAAGHLYKLLSTRGDADVVWDNMKSLVSQEGFKKPETEETGGETE